MVAPVAVVLRILDVILDLNDLDIILLCDEIGDRINIINKCAYDTHSGNIVQLFLYVLCGKVVAELFQLVVYALWAFNPCLNKRDRIAFVLYGKFII